MLDLTFYFLFQITVDVKNFVYKDCFIIFLSNFIDTFNLLVYHATKHENMKN